MVTLEDNPGQIPNLEVPTKQVVDLIKRPLQVLVVFFIFSPSSPMVAAVYTNTTFETYLKICYLRPGLGSKTSPWASTCWNVTASGTETSGTSQANRWKIENCYNYTVLKCG